MGTSVFAAINDKSTNNTAKIPVGTISVIAAVLASIQTLLGYSQLAERHRVAAARYAALRREIQEALTMPEPKAVESIRREMDKIGAVGPQIGERVWRRALKRAREEVSKGLVPPDPEVEVLGRSV